MIFTGVMSQPGEQYYITSVIIFASSYSLISGVFFILMTAYKDSALVVSVAVDIYSLITI